MAVSRRAFLQVLGMSTSATALHAAVPTALLQQPAALGRALCAAPVLDSAGREAGRLFPDSIVSLLRTEDQHYVTSAGRVARAHVQPLDRPGQGAPPAVLPAWSEVHAPSAPLRRWASADAAHVGTVGHGGVLAAIDRVQSADGAWLGMAESLDGPLLGWTPAARWRETPAAGRPLVTRVLLDTAASRLSAGSADGLRWSWAAAAHALVQSGSYRLQHGRCCGCWADTPGVPWLLNADGLTLGGVYWHNNFDGGAAGQPWRGPDVHLPPVAARWLYLHLSEGAVLDIV